MQEINDIYDELTRINSHNPKHVIFNNKQLSEMMGVCTKTLQKWRDRGAINYSKIGKQLFYTLDDVLLMLQKNKVNSFS